MVVIWTLLLLIVIRDGSSMSITVDGAMLKVVPLMVMLCCGGGFGVCVGCCGFGVYVGGGGAFDVYVGGCCSLSVSSKSGRSSGKIVL